MKEEITSTVPVENRRLAAIMFTDIVGISRQMGTDEARRLRLLEVHNQLIRQAVNTHHGHVIKTIGDAFLVDFPSYLIRLRVVLVNACIPGTAGSGAGKFPITR
jgi:class 3 adenylate cyclase